MNKTCIRCEQQQPLGEFYRHPGMADGHINKCRSCCKAEAAANRVANLDRYRDYDRRRLLTAKRKADRADRQIRYRAANPLKQAARAAVARAVRSGLLAKQCCQVCGCESAEAHHDDYGQPLAVRWLCRKHHLITHGTYMETAT